MAVNGLTVGKSLTLNLHTSKGELVIPNITSFTIKPATINLKDINMAGRVRYANLPTGYMGTIQITRGNNAMEQYWLQYQQDYLNGENLLPSTITTTTVEVDGSVSQLVYTGVMFDMKDFGEYSGETYVKQTLDFQCELMQNN
jgi:hypothetical protein